MIFREIEIKMDGGCYKFIVTVTFWNFLRNLFPIGPNPRGFVHSKSVDREISSSSHPCDYILYTFYRGWDLIGTLTFKDFPYKSWFSGLKSDFDLISTTRSISMSFSSILFMPEGDDRSFHENLISECVCTLWFIWEWLLNIKGWLM